MKKEIFCICQNKDAVTPKLISAFVSAKRFELFIYFLNSKFQASFHLLWLNSRFMLDLVGNKEDRFSLDKAQLW